MCVCVCVCVCECMLVGLVNKYMIVGVFPHKSASYVVPATNIAKV